MDGEDSELLLNQARIFLLKGRFEKAADPLARLISIDPKSAQAKSLLAICRAKGRFTSEAERLVKESMEADPSSPYPNLALAILKSEQGRQQEASAAFEKAIASSPNDAFFYLQYSLFLKKIGKAQEALTASEKAGRLDPEMEGLQALLTELRASIPRKTAEPLPEQGEIQNSWFYAKVPDGWVYSSNPEKNVHFFTDSGIPSAYVSIAIISGNPGEMADMSGGFYSFVASDAGAQPARTKERKMRVGKASEVHVSTEENGVKMRKIYVGYPYKDSFYVICGTCPEEPFPQFGERLESFISAFLPKGISPTDVPSSPSSAGHGAGGMKDMAISAGAGLVGALIALGGIYLFVTSLLSGFQADMGAMYLLVTAIGYLPVANIAFRFSPKSIYLLHLIYFALLAACASTAYIAMGSGSLLGTLLFMLTLLLLPASALIALSVLLFGRSNSKEFGEAYPEFYAMVKQKYVKSLP